MTTTKLYYNAFVPAFSNIGVAIAQAKLYFYYTGTDTLAPIFSNAAATVPLTNPVQANLAGKYVDIYLDASVTYRVRQTDKRDVPVGDDVDPYIPGTAMKGDKGDTGAPGVTVEQFGGVGYLTAAAAKIGTDNKTAFQNAINAVVAMGGGTIYLSKPHYGYVGADLNTDVGLIINGAHVTFHSTCGRTDLWRRAVNMADPAVWANWPNGRRGSGIKVKGPVAAPANFSERSGLTLRGVFFQGGTTKSVSNNFNPANGDGWDIYDKGIWCEADRYIGLIEIENGGVEGFRGELVYAPNDTGSTLRIRNGIFGETNGQCINANSCRLDVDGLYGYNANFAIEGWGGDRGKLLNTTFENCENGGAIQGGKFGAGTFSSYYAPTRISATVTPYLKTDNLTLKRCGTMALGAWIDAGKVTAVDGRVTFSNGTFADGLFDTHIDELVFVTDQITGAGLDFVGGDGVSSATQSVRDVRIGKVSFVRTKAAIAASRYPGAPVSWYGSLGPRIVIDDVTGDGFNSHPTNSAAWSDHAPSFLRTNMTGANSTPTQNVQTSPGLAWLGPIVNVVTTGSAVYPMNLPNPALVEAGSELILQCGGPGQVYVNGNPSSGSNLKSPLGPVFLPLGYVQVRFRSNGFQWEHVSGGVYTATTTVANLPAASADWQMTRLVVTDSNAASYTAGIGTVVAAGGTTKVPVTAADATNWRIG